MALALFLIIDKQALEIVSGRTIFLFFAALDGSISFFDVVHKGTFVDVLIEPESATLVMLLAIFQETTVLVTILLVQSHRLLSFWSCYLMKKVGIAVLIPDLEIVGPHIAVNEFDIKKWLL